jgi:hypothetical protein
MEKFPGMLIGTRAEMSESVEEFLDFYFQSPIEKNQGGMGFNHSWALWYSLRRLQPDVVVESGVWHGHSTYIIEKAVPNAELLCFDLSFNNLIYSSNSAKYYETDITNFDWQVYRDKNVCAFFDDHQSHYKRVMQSYFYGFKWLIFDDNYPEGEGDLYSLRHIFAEVGSSSLQKSKKHIGSKREQRLRRKLESLLWSVQYNQDLLRSANQFDSKNLEKVIKYQIEMPPVYMGKITQFGAEYEGHYAGGESVIE